MVAVIPNMLIVGDQASLPPKKTRASKKPVDAVISRALLALPEWVQDTVISVVIPSIVKFYGARDFPWDLGGKSNTDYANILNAILRHLHPDRQHDLRPSDKLWRFVSIPLPYVVIWRLHEFDSSTDSSSCLRLA